ncbi:FecR/PupR family sigma factor regulator [Microbulbifer sp. M83]|uniref:FecR/PupR family sigma factor regulator n=1 Tax=unclassified Microbulbifer TaxID=2619833 RepID=UPI002FE03B0C
MQLDEWLCIGIPDEVQEQASAWLARLDADHVSLDERQRLSRWLDADPTHRWAFDELSQLYARAATLSTVRARIDAPRVLLFPQPATPRAPSPSAPPADTAAAASAPSFRQQWQPVVAMALIAIGLVLSLGQPPASQPRQSAEPAPAHYAQPPSIEQNLISAD